MTQHSRSVSKYFLQHATVSYYLLLTFFFYYTLNSLSFSLLSQSLPRSSTPSHALLSLSLSFSQPGSWISVILGPHGRS